MTATIGKSLKESAVRARARRTGYVVKKSRRPKSINNQGGYRLVDANRNAIVAGERYELELVDVAAWVDGEE